jgi:hypothetical protein
LEEEQFSVIPAPVYARGFLRSYSQYLGLDPQEAMARYPREEDAYAPPIAQGAQGAGRATARAPQSRPPQSRPAQESGRPTWKRPTPIRGGGEGVVPVTPPSQRGDDGWEPTIGVDIGVPVPTRRLDRDPAAQTRTATVVVVAIAAIVVVLLLAFLVSRAGGGDNQGGIIPDASNTVAGAGADSTETATTEEPTTAVSTAVAGIVPEVRGKLQGDAVADIRAAGFVEKVLVVDSNEPQDTVVDQSPAPGQEGGAGSEVIIQVSRGPN